MHEKLQEFARNELKQGLAKLPKGWQHMFKQMYGHKMLDHHINDVVDAMPEDTLENAMKQVDASVRKLLLRRK